MTGTLETVSLIDLISILGYAKRSGQLDIELTAPQQGPHTAQDAPKSASLYWINGQIQHAQYGAYYGEDAVRLLLQQPAHGTYFFNEGTSLLATIPTTITTSTEVMLHKHYQALPKTPQTPQVLDFPPSPEFSGASWNTHHTLEDNDLTSAFRSDITGNTIPCFTEEQPEIHSAGLDSKGLQIAQYINGKRTINYIADLTDSSSEDVRITVSRLSDAGLIILRKKARVARLVVKVAHRKQVTAGSVGIDSNIMKSWARTLDQEVSLVHCRLPDKRVISVPACSVDDPGPYILIPHALFLSANLQADMPLLVKPETT